MGWGGFVFLLVLVLVLVVAVPEYLTVLYAKGGYLEMIRGSDEDIGDSYEMLVRSPATYLLQMQIKFAIYLLEDFQHPGLVCKSDLKFDLAISEPPVVCLRHIV